jgi:hypothetical protein
MCHFGSSQIARPGEGTRLHHLAARCGSFDTSCAAATPKRAFGGRRSSGAQASIDEYGPDPPPKNGSADALHADHVNPFAPEQLTAITTVEGW